MIVLDRYRLDGLEPKKEGVIEFKLKPEIEKKFTVFYDSVTSYQILASTQTEARIKAEKLYKNSTKIPVPYIQTGWIVDDDGEDK